MAKMPKAQWQGEHSPQRPMARYDIVCVHTIVGFAPAHAAHFSTKADGTILQSRDTRYQSAANLDGNHRVIAIENEDHGPRFGGTPKLPRWVPLTPEQVESCAQILAWAHMTHGVPLQLAPDSRPKSRGLAYHRQGINGNFGEGTSYPNPGRVPGGEVWSSSTGKVCPSDVRINQLPEILARAKEIVNPQETGVKLKFIHTSMQFSDTDKQMRHDVKAIFGRDPDIATFTEAGPGQAEPLDRLLKEEAQRRGYRFYSPKAPTDCAIAVKETLVDGKWKTNYTPVIPGSSALNDPRKFGPKGVVSVSFHNKELGNIWVGASHYLTMGRRPGQYKMPKVKGHPEYPRDRYGWNRRLADQIAKEATEAAKGDGLAFYCGDQNIRDDIADTFFGAPLTSLWDELEKWENTGHGPIDVIATHDKDGRVKAVRINALNDKEVFLHTDHYLVEGIVNVRPLRRT